MVDLLLHTEQIKHVVRLGRVAKVGPEVQAKRRLRLGGSIYRRCEIGIPQISLPG